MYPNISIETKFRYVILTLPANKSNLCYLFIINTDFNKVTVSIMHSSVRNPTSSSRITNFRLASLGTWHSVHTLYYSCTVASTACSKFKEHLMCVQVQRKLAHPHSTSPHPTQLGARVAAGSAVALSVLLHVSFHVSRYVYLFVSVHESCFCSCSCSLLTAVVLILVLSFFHSLFGV